MVSKIMREQIFWLDCIPELPNLAENGQGFYEVAKEVSCCIRLRDVLQILRKFTKRVEPIEERS